MPQEYTYSRRFRIFVYCLIAPVAVIPLIAFYGIIIEGIKTPQEAFLAVVDIVPCSILALYCINVMSSVLTSDTEGIRYRSSWYSRTLLWKDISGYRWHEGILVLIPAIKGKRKLWISDQRHQFNELFKWVATHYPDLDDKITSEVITAENKVDAKYRHMLRRAKHTARAFNITAFVLMASFIFYVITPLPFLDFLRWAPFPMMALLLALPAVMEYHKGWLIVFENKEEQTLPCIIWALLFGSVGLAACFFGVYSLRLDLIWMAVLLITVVFTALVLFTSRRWKIAASDKIWGIAGFAVLLLPTAFGSIVYLNTFFDHSTPQIFETTIANKRIAGEQRRSHYLVLAPWGPEKSELSLSVSPDGYKAAAIGDTVRMELHHGALGLPWYRPLMPSDD